MHGQRNTTAIPTKRCGCCRRRLPLTDFAQHAKAPDGCQWECRDCRSEYNRRWSATHGRRLTAKTRRYRRDHPEQVAAWRAARRAHPTRPPACEWCGRGDRRVERHHFDYRHPGQIEWLCGTCHDRADFLRRVAEAERQRSVQHRGAA